MQRRKYAKRTTLQTKSYKVVQKAIKVYKLGDIKTRRDEGFFLYLTKPKKVGAFFGFVVYMFSYFFCRELSFLRVVFANHCVRTMYRHVLFHKF